MNKPLKREDVDHTLGCSSEGECGGCESIGYNEACLDWEAWLKEVANVEDMTTFICNWFTENGFTLQVNFCTMEISKEPIKDLAKAISESILGKNEKIRS